MTGSYLDKYINVERLEYHMRHSFELRKLVNAAITAFDEHTASAESLMKTNDALSETALKVEKDKLEEQLSLAHADLIRVRCLVSQQAMEIDSLKKKLESLTGLT